MWCREEKYMRKEHTQNLLLKGNPLREYIVSFVLVGQISIGHNRAEPVIIRHLPFPLPIPARVALFNSTQTKLQISIYIPLPHLGTHLAWSNLSFHSIVVYGVQFCRPFGNVSYINCTTFYIYIINCFFTFCFSCILRMKSVYHPFTMLSICNGSERTLLTKLCFPHFEQTMSATIAFDANAGSR